MFNFDIFKIFDFLFKILFILFIEYFFFLIKYVIIVGFMFLDFDFIIILLSGVNFIVVFID